MYHRYLAYLWSVSYCSYWANNELIEPVSDGTLIPIDWDSFGEKGCDWVGEGHCFCIRREEDNQVNRYPDIREDRRRMEVLIHSNQNIAIHRYLDSNPLLCNSCWILSNRSTIRAWKLWAEIEVEKKKNNNKEVIPKVLYQGKGKEKYRSLPSIPFGC